MHCCNSKRKDFLQINKEKGFPYSDESSPADKWSKGWCHWITILPTSTRHNGSTDLYEDRFQSCSTKCSQKCRRKSLESSELHLLCNEEQQIQKQTNAYRILLFNLNQVVLKLLEKSRVRETNGALASAIQNRQSFFFS